MRQNQLREKLSATLKERESARHSQAELEAIREQLRELESGQTFRRRSDRAIRNWSRFDSRRIRSLRKIIRSSSPI